MPRGSKSDLLDRARTITAGEAVASEMARVIHDELATWPPRLEWTDARARERFAPLFAEGAPRPSAAAIDEGFRLARWDLAREYDAIDFYRRNDHASRVCPDERDRLAIDLIWHMLVEMLLELGEATGGRLKRPALIACLDEARRRVLAC